ncbi:hypothetical protein MTO96_036311 [Rhipicephalus appendiculatus]
MERQQNEDFRASNTDDIHWRPTNGPNCLRPDATPKARTEPLRGPGFSASSTGVFSGTSRTRGPGPQLAVARSLRDEEDGGVTYNSLAKQAMHDPNTLNTEEIQRLTRCICQIASRSVEHTEMAANFCKQVASKAENMPMRWTPYVTFVAKLLLVFDASDAKAGDAVVTTGNEMPDGSGRSAARQLAFLLSGCLQTILRPPSLGSVAEMECLKSAMSAAGKAMQRMEPHLMRMLMARMRDAFLEDGTSVRMRKILLELIDLHGSGWQLTPAQQKYYDPARSFKRRE